MPRRTAANLRAPLALGLAAVAGLSLTAVVDPNQPGHYPTCLFLATTGFYCPGCGTLRSMHALTQGNLGLAWRENPFFIVIAVIGIAIWVAWIRHARRGERLHFPWPRWAQIVLPTLITAYWILRNVPGLEFLAPA